MPHRELELTVPSNIRDLPDEYPDYGKESEENLQRYQELRAQLSRYPDLLDALRKKHAYYRRLEQLVVPFENPQESVQPNIVTSTGELGKELERMRLLAARLAAQVERIKQDDIARSDGDGDMEMTDDDKLRKLLAGLS